MSEILLSKEDVLNIPKELLPMPVLSDNLRSFMAWGIKAHTRGSYNHFMWLIRPGVFASQNFLYAEQPASDYFEKYRLKFWCHRGWTPEDRVKIIGAIEDHLKKPWYCRLYDVPAIFGQLVWHDIQIPGLQICSDSGAYLGRIDERYKLRHPDPQQVNQWLEDHPDYHVYGRYLPD
jgi:hypothetical protein